MNSFARIRISSTRTIAYRATPSASGRSIAASSPRLSCGRTTHCPRRLAWMTRPTGDEYGRSQSLRSSSRRPMDTRSNRGLPSSATAESSAAKAFIPAKLIEFGVPLVDVGMGLYEEGALGGLLRTTTITVERSAHARTRISSGGGSDDPYVQNIQIAELN